MKLQWTPFSAWTPHTKMAWRATVAATIAIVVSATLGLERGYWATLTVLLLISQSWGESVEKAFKRFSMTVIGCCVGWLLYHWVGDNTVILFCVLLLCVFMMVYWIQTSYAWAMFFVAVMVVFIFSYFMTINGHLIWERIYETGIGCVIAVVVSGVFLPNFSRQKLRSQVPHLLEHIGHCTHSVMVLGLAGESLKEPLSDIRKLSAEVEALRREYKSARYEMYFVLHFRQRVGQILLKLEVNFHYLNSLAHTLPSLAGSDALAYFHEDFLRMQTHLEQRYQQIQQRLNGETIERPLPLWEDEQHLRLRQRFMEARQAKRFTPELFMALTACVYYCRRLDAELAAVFELLG